MFGFDSAEGADRESAAGVALKVFDVGAGAETGFLEGLHGAVAVFAAHEFGAFGEGFVEGAGEPAAAHLHFALRHDRRFLLRRHRGLDACPAGGATGSRGIGWEGGEPVGVGGVAG
jgi:hypothetical protein